MKPPIQNHWLRRIALAVAFVALGVVLSLGAFVIWLSTYPEDADPKNIYYVLWKRGLNNSINIDSALVAMSHDTWPVRLVEGLTKEQLKTHFGYIRKLEEVSPYYQACYYTPNSAGRAETGDKSEDALFLRDSPWMVVMKNGKAVDLILCKGY